MLRELDIESTLNQTKKNQKKDIESIFQYFINEDTDENIILVGDHNIPSHLDHNESTINNLKYDFNRNFKTVNIPWPVSQFLYQNNFIDSFRFVNKNVLKNYGFTWYLFFLF
jgi:exonuclease III